MGHWRISFCSSSPSKNRLPDGGTPVRNRHGVLPSLTQKW